MEIVFHAHHAGVSEALRRRAERAVRSVAKRVPRVVEAIIRFEEDGKVRKVSVRLRAPRKHEFAGRAEGRYFGPALTAAIKKIQIQVRRDQVVNKGPGARPHARARRRD